ncbi:MAG TPA: hypothetical protein VE439_10435, partial [Anaerolineae bacterium]|nr:hypothetical protein [Anaerolineae bacterium]
MSIRASNALLTLNMIKDAAGSTVYSRGRSYYKSGMVLEWEEEEPGIVTGLVDGSGDWLYETEIDFRSGYLESSCTCPYDWSDVCKHAVALALEYLESVTGSEKEEIGVRVLSFFDRDESSDSFSWQYALDNIVGQPEAEQKSNYYRVIYRMSPTKEGQLRVELYKARIGKRGKGSENDYYYNPLSPSNFVRDKDKAILSLLSSGPYYYPIFVPHEVIDPLLRLLADEEYIFLGSSDKKPYIASSPIEANLILTEVEKAHKFEVSFQPEKINEFKDKLYVLGEDNPWLTDGISFFPLKTKMPGSALRSFLKKPHAIPEEHISLFMERYYDALLDKGALEIKSTRIKDVRDDISPRPVLHLE